MEDFTNNSRGTRLTGYDLHIASLSTTLMEIDSRFRVEKPCEGLSNVKTLLGLGAELWPSRYSGSLESTVLLNMGTNVLGRVPIR